MLIVIDGVVHGAILTERHSNPACLRDGHRWSGWTFYYAIAGASEHLETQYCMRCMDEEFRHAPGDKPRPPSR